MMLPYSSLISIDPDSQLSSYKQLANSLIGLIQNGTLIPGSSLPGTRSMATLLQLNRKTVVNAYEELVIQGWFQVAAKKGFRVMPELPVMKPRSFKPKSHFTATELDVREPVRGNAPEVMINPEKLKKTDIVINDGFPDALLAPYNDIAKLYRIYADSEPMKKLMSWKDDCGLPSLKVATSKFLNESRGLNITAEEIAITRGAQMAIYLSARTLLKAGDRVVVGATNYFFANQLFKEIGVEILTVAVDEEGMVVDELEALLQTQEIKLLYVVPHHHHPTTVTLSTSRRLKLLNLLNKHHFYMIEDDYDYDFHYRNSPILPIASAAHAGRIIYIGSFTKLLGPSFRLGYVVASKGIIQEIIRYKKLVDLRGDTYMEQMLATMINSGGLARHIKKSNKLYQQRCDYACELFAERLPEGVSFTRPHGGMAIWLKFDNRFKLSGIIRAAAAKGLYFMGAVFEDLGEGQGSGLRFGFASLSLQEIDSATAILKEVTVINR